MSDPAIEATYVWTFLVEGRQDSLLTRPSHISISMRYPSYHYLDILISPTLCLFPLLV